MHFDDRLATVLRTRAHGAATARIQFRQLIDLIGTLGPEVRSPQMDAAYARLAELSAAIDAGARAAILREPGLRLRNPRLLAALCSDEPRVAEAALDQADLGEEQWLDLIPALPLHARALLRRGHSLGPGVDGMLARLGIRDRGLPPAQAETIIAPGPNLEPAEAVEPIAEAPEPPRIVRNPPLPPLDEAGGIRALVKRIEDFRKVRRALDAELAADSPRLPLGDGDTGPQTPPRAVDFATDTEGAVTWTSPAVAPMLVGLKLAAIEQLALPIRRRLPARGVAIELAGAPAISGRWRLDMSPRFDSVGGRFTGYAGRLRRPASGAAAPVAREVAEGDRIRQLLHELRTPVNAIQGFAEVIQQQLFGHAPHEYRALAAAIAGDAARILAGFEELERLARLDTGALRPEPGACDLAAILGATASHLETICTPRGVTIQLESGGKPVPVPLAQAEAERMGWRLVATLAAAAGPGETIAILTASDGGTARVRLSLPASLASRAGEDLFLAGAPQAQQAVSVGMFGAGFALRLVRAEARAAGGSLERQGEFLHLELPGLTRSAAGHSEEAA